jgi:hypothetical protein
MKRNGKFNSRSSNIRAGTRVEGGGAGPSRLKVKAAEWVVGG